MGALGKIGADGDFRCLKGGKKSGKETITPAIPILCSETFPGLRELTAGRVPTSESPSPANRSQPPVAPGFLRVPAERFGPGRLPAAGRRLPGEQDLSFLSNGFFRPPRFWRHSGTSHPPKHLVNDEVQNSPSGLGRTNRRSDKRGHATPVPQPCRGSEANASLWKRQPQPAPVAHANNRTTLRKQRAPAATRERGQASKTRGFLHIYKSSQFSFRFE